MMMSDISDSVKQNYYDNYKIPGHYIRYICSYYYDYYQLNIINEKTLEDVIKFNTLSTISRYKFRLKIMICSIFLNNVNFNVSLQSLYCDF